MTVVITDTSIKNHVATLIAHIYSHYNPIIKTIHYAINIITTKAELFAIRYNINQATHLPNSNCIVVITDLLQAAKRIFDSSSYLYQLQSMSILHELCKFFIKNINNSIEFWEYSSNQNWSLYFIVNKEIKKFNLIPLFPSKSLWDFSKKKKYNDILNNWKIIFQALDNKGHHFLELVDNNLQPIELFTANSSSWLKYFSHSNLLCTQATRAIVNYALISKY